MHIRKATAADVWAAGEIYVEARKFMRESGNPDQWKDGHPNSSDVAEGVNSGVSYVCVDGEEVVGTFYFRVGEDQAYREIFEGEWLSGGEYAAIHRIAVKHRGKGIAQFIFEECFRMFPNIKIDTHRDNLPMQRTLAKCGFKYCGIIHLGCGEERLAYQKIK